MGLAQGGCDPIEDGTHHIIDKEIRNGSGEALQNSHAVWRKRVIYSVAPI